MPFTFIQFFYAPWLDAQHAKARAPRELPEELHNHVILTNLDSMTENLIEKLTRHGYPYVILVEDPQQAFRLHDLGYKTVVGDYGDPETYTRLRVSRAALVVASSDDLINTSVTFTIRGICGTVPIIANAAEALEENRIPYKIVEKSRLMIRDEEHFIQGNSADIAVLDKAGILEARSVLITTHNDDINIYLTIYCRSLRPDIQIISRANNERSVSKLHRAGADQVLSYASMSANSILNLLMPGQLLMAEEGMSILIPTRGCAWRRADKSVIPEMIVPVGGGDIKNNSYKKFFKIRGELVGFPVGGDKFG